MKEIDWSAIAGVAVIGGIAIVALVMGAANAHDIAVASVGALAGWMGHKAVGP